MWRECLIIYFCVVAKYVPHPLENGGLGRPKCWIKKAYSCPLSHTQGRRLHGHKRMSHSSLVLPLRTSAQLYLGVRVRVYCICIEQYICTFFSPYVTSVLCLIGSSAGDLPAILTISSRHVKGVSVFCVSVLRKKIKQPISCQNYYLFPFTQVMTETINKMMMSRTQLQLRHLHV